MNSPASGTPLLEVQGVNKSFGPVHVLHDVDFAVYPGEVTALVGDNGAGKTTLIKCISGIYGVDSGQTFFDGAPVTIHTPRDAAALGIEVVYQDLALCDNLDIVQNMFLGREKTTAAGLDEPGMEAPLAKTLAGLSVRTVKSVRQTVVEPLRRPAPDRRHREGRALEQPRDDPRRADRRTRCRADPASARLVRRLAKAGIGVVLISHNMNDVFEVSDRICALYLGRVAAEVKRSDTTHSQVVELITAGRSGDLGLRAAEQVQV